MGVGSSFASSSSFLSLSFESVISFAVSTSATGSVSAIFWIFNLLRSICDISFSATGCTTSSFFPFCSFSTAAPAFSFSFSSSGFSGTTSSSNSGRKNRCASSHTSNCSRGPCKTTRDSGMSNFPDVARSRKFNA